VFVVVSVYFVFDSVRKLLDTVSYFSSMMSAPIFMRGGAIGQVVTCRFLTSENRVQSHGSSCGICGARNGTGADFTPSSSVSSASPFSGLLLGFKVFRRADGRLPFMKGAACHFQTQCPLHDHCTGVMVETGSVTDVQRNGQKARQVLRFACVY
jgi:hypothetical protein